MKIIFLSLLAIKFSSSLPVNEQVDSCGLPAIKPDPSSNIVGGKEAIPYSWPWQVALFHKGGNQFCGGTLISNQWVLTAAHCFYKKEKPDVYSVKLGVYSKSKVDEPGELILDLSEVHVNPKFDWDDTTSDICLLKLNESVAFTDHISPICLPTVDDELPDSGTTLFLTGWGRTETGIPNETLKQVEVPLAQPEKCTNTYPGLFNATHHVCIGLDEGGRGACNGDSGGPAVYQEATTGKWRQIGIASWAGEQVGGDCVDAKTYSVYSKVSHYLEFIHEYVKDV